MNFLKIPLLLLLFLSYGLFVQAQHSCGTTEALEVKKQGATERSLHHCFEVYEVQEGCTPVYVNVNVHYFLDDNCEGLISVAPGEDVPETTAAALARAEVLVSETNAFTAGLMSDQWGQVTHGVQDTEPKCLPVRFALAGVRFHCDTDAQLVGESFSELNAYVVNGAMEINVFITDISTTANGFAGIGGTKFVVENFEPSNFLHEIAHNFGVRHTFNPNETCPDTWDEEWEWDLDGDGIDNVIVNACWDASPDYNNQDACDTEIFATEHPCCDWFNQNNNIMGYGQWALNVNSAAVTPCQVNQMLEELSENKCDYIEYVGGCPPPKANINEFLSGFDPIFCRYCFYLNASFDETLYDIVITDAAGNVKLNTGHIYGKAGKYCLTSRSTGKNGELYWQNNLMPEVPYTLKLSVQNDCGQTEVETIDFILPPPCAGHIEVPNEIFFLKGITPNPASSFVNIELEVSGSGQLKIFGSHPTSLTSYGVIYEGYLEESFDHQVQLNISEFYPGVNTLLFEYNGQLIGENIIKL